MSVKKPGNPKQLVAAEQATLDHQYQLDHQMVRGVFKSLKQKNSPLRFPFRKYKQDAIKFYPEDIKGKPQYFVDGRTYEIPLMIANHLNNRCYREVSRNMMTNNQYSATQLRDTYGNYLYEAPTIDKDHRFMFVSTDFKPVKGWEEPSQLVEVDKKLII
jgi:hypothetical protein